jgi:DNA modification methylase
VRFIETRDIPVGELTDYPGNARVHDDVALDKSIQANGQYRAVVARLMPDGTAQILAGHGTKAAIARAGVEAVRVELIEADDTEARRINLVDNGAQRNADYDETALLALLDEASKDGGLIGTGWDPDAYRALIDSMDEGNPYDYRDPESEVSEEIPEPPVDPITKPGDLWEMGGHRLLCGDCRDRKDFLRLIDGASIALAFTSPPYARQRKYDEASAFRPVAPDDYLAWFEPVQANIASALADDGSWLLNIKEHAEDGQRHLYVKDLTLAHVREWSWRFVDELIWVHNGLPGAWDNRHKNQFEPIFHFTRGRRIKFRPERNSIDSKDAFSYSGPLAPASTGNPISWSGSGVERENGKALPGNVLQIGKSHEAFKHEAVFPLALPMWFIRAYSDPDDIVLDPFMGSGTSLIAAHMQQRIGYGFEISPAYCDVIVRRWQELTKATPLRNGRPEDMDSD